jgi:hypothetical protein
LGWPGPFPEVIQVNGSGLTGGKTGTKPTTNSSIYLPGNNNSFLSPIPSDLLFTAHSSP